MPAPHKTDIGVAVELTVKENGTAVNLSSVSTKQIILRDPTGAVTTHTATFTTDGTDGKIRYVTIAGDFATTGDWQAQGYLAGLTGFTGYTDVVGFTVRPNLA